MTRAVRVRVLAAFVAVSVGPIIFLSSAVRAEEVCAPTDTDCTLETMPSPSTEPAEDAGQLLEPLVTIVGDVLDEGPVPDPPGGGGTGHVPGSNSGSSGSATDGSGDAGPTATTRESVVPAPTIISAASGSRPLPSHGSRGRFAPLIEETVRSLVLLLVLVGFAAGFVLLQDRVDRNDPKLGATPARADVITFV